MIVRFDGEAVSCTLERKSAPIGVDGDPTADAGLGISEADAIVDDARRHLDEQGLLVSDQGNTASLGAGDRAAITEQAIREEKEQEPGPELNI